MSSIHHEDPVWEGVRQMAMSLFKPSRDRGALTGLDVEAWRSVWPDAGPREFADALAKHARGGNVWMPEPGEFAAYLAVPDVDAPSFSEVLGVVDGARYLPASEAVERMTRKCGPVAAAWMCAEGVAALAAMELAHPEYGPSVRRDLERRFQAFVAGQKDRARRGLPLAQATVRGHLEQSSPRRMDFGAAVPQIDGGQS